MACHSVTMVNDTPVGNFVDVEMFGATGAKLAEGGGMVYLQGEGGGRGIKIVKRFEFVHSRAYMSVLVKDVRTGVLSVFMKGGFW